MDAAPANGHPAPKLKEVREQVRAARLQAELRRLQAETHLYETLLPPTAWYGTQQDYYSPFRGFSAYGDWPPVLGTGRRDDQNRTTWNAQEAEWSRGYARWLADYNLVAQGILGHLTNYTVRQGFEYEPHPARRFKHDDTAKSLAKMVENLIDEVQQLNVVGEGGDEYVWADRERECVLRASVDGECLLRVFDDGDGHTSYRFVEPEDVRPPPEAGPEYSWGVLTDARDVERRKQYCVWHHDPESTSEDYEEVPAAEICHHRSNVVSTVKRGLSDFHCTSEALDHVRRLLRNLAAGATVQATIPWIEKFNNVSAEGLARHVGAVKDLNRFDSQNPVTGRTPTYQRREPGEVLKVGGDREFLPAPSPAGASQHVQIAQACLRALGNRWGMPEYMVSGDASNANYASTLVSGSPFVVAVECHQARLGRFFVRCLWKAVRHAADAGRFTINGHTFTYEEISRLVDIVATPPVVAIADQSAEASIDQQDMQIGVMSIQTRRARRGLDDETEDANLKAKPLTRVPGKVTDIDPAGNPSAPEGGEAGPGGGGGPPPAPFPAAGPMREGVQPNKTGPGCHDTETGHPAKCPGPEEQHAERQAARQSPEEAAREYAEKGTRAASFKAWFGDWESDPENSSKVANPQTGEPTQTHNLPEHTSQVTREGKPVAVFHGTPGAAFHEFKREKLRNPEALVYGPGFYFAEDRRVADLYARQNKTPGEVMTVYLNIRQPFRVSQSYTPEQFQQMTGQKPGFFAKLFGTARKSYTGDEVYNALARYHGGRAGAEQRLRQLGFDGIHTSELNGDRTEVWIAFEPNQIKSVDNQGTFDPESKKIHEGAEGLRLVPPAETPEVPPEVSDLLDALKEKGT